MKKIFLALLAVLAVAAGTVLGQVDFAVHDNDVGFSQLIETQHVTVPATQTAILVASPALYPQTLCPLVSFGKDAALHDAKTTVKYWHGATARQADAMPLEISITKLQRSPLSITAKERAVCRARAKPDGHRSMNPRKPAINSGFSFSDKFP